MSSLYEKILALCIQRGIKPGRLCAETGLSRGLMTDLKMGRTKELSARNLKIIADYFGVAADYLLGGAAEKPAVPKDGELVDSIIMSRDGKTVRRKYTKEQREALRVILENMPYLEDEEL